MSEAKNIFFVSDYRAYSIANNNSELKPIKLDGKEYGSGKPVAQFTSYLTIDEKEGVRKYKGCLILNSEKDKDKIEWLKSQPDFMRGFAQVSNLPLNFHDGSIMTGVGSLSQQEALKKSLKTNFMQKGVRLTELKIKLYTASGALKDKHDPSELAEYEELLKEMNS